MRTAIVSDLHLGAPAARTCCATPRSGASCSRRSPAPTALVLLGDVVELRDLPLGAVARAPPGPSSRSWARRWAAARSILVPGNHDHRLAEPLLDELSLAGEPALGLEHRDAPAAGAAGR